jgi:hypothetical protein
LTVCCPSKLIWIFAFSRMSSVAATAAGLSVDGRISRVWAPSKFPLVIV